MKNKHIHNKHNGIGSRWLTVPNIFPDPEDISNKTWYYLSEGYCVGDYESKESGKYYKKIRTKYCDSVDNLLYALGYKDWYKEYKIERNPVKRFLFGAWKRK